MERIARLRSTIVLPGPGPKLPFLDPDAGAVRHARVDGRAQARQVFGLYLSKRWPGKISTMSLPARETGVPFATGILIPLLA